MLKIEINQSSLYFLPFFPENLETTQAVLKALCQINPNGVGLCLPSFLKEVWIKGVSNLPSISVIEIKYKQGFQEYQLITPLCPLVEGTRYAIETQKTIYFIDLPYMETQRFFELPLANLTYLLKKVSYQEYTEAYLNLISKLPPHKEETFPHEETERSKYHYIAGRIKEICKKENRFAVILPFSFLNRVLESLRETSDNVLHFPKMLPEEIEIYSLHPRSIREILLEPGYFHKKYEENRKKLIEETNFSMDRLSIWEEIMHSAILKYEEETGTKISPRDYQILRQFLKNYLFVKNKFLPDLIDLILVARGVGGDELAFWVWEMATSYDLKKESLVFPLIRLSPEDLNLPSKKLRFSRKIKSLRNTFRFLKKFTTPEERKSLRRTFSGKFICSFPPEDIIVETFGKKATEKGIKVITENLKKIEPFLVSLKDGLDLRETIRNWTLKEEIFVKEEPKASAKVGSIVIIFEEDPDPVTRKEKYPWNFTWHGEHHQESDMAFYATDPKENIIGPGIGRAKYGGFMLTYPPQRVYDIWRDPLFFLAENKPEKLLLAAIEYSLEKYVLYIAKKPPSSFAKNWALREGKKVIFLPIGTFSRSYLEKIRIFHVLEGHHVRAYAHKFINKPGDL